MKAPEPGQFSAVVMLGMDRFSQVNETLGYAIGDELLSRVSERLESALRKKDRLLRLPGDAFAILLQSISSLEEIESIVKRLKDLLQRTYLIDDQLVNVVFSMGVGFDPQGDESADKVLRRAEIALKSAKSIGAGTVQFFETGMAERIAMRHALALDLRKALPLRQLEVHYQPQIEMKSEALTGFEALLRWKHPERGWISPSEFIPIAEETGLIEAIGEWVLRTACKQAANLSDDIVMAVNASPLQFGKSAFQSSVQRALLAAGLPARRLEVEITEGVLLKNERSNMATIESLRAMGVRLAMDDFGTGYSSLGQLAQLPFDTIKIDRSLVGGSAKQRAIVRAITTLGGGIGMSTLAEGIETEEQLLKAHADGCISAQGYLFGKAVPASELSSVIERLSRPTTSDLKRRVAPDAFMQERKISLGQTSHRTLA